MALAGSVQPQVLRRVRGQATPSPWARVVAGQVAKVYAAQAVTTLFLEALPQRLEEALGLTTVRQTQPGLMVVLEVAGHTPMMALALRRSLTLLVGQVIPQAPPHLKDQMAEQVAAQLQRLAAAVVAVRLLLAVMVLLLLEVTAATVQLLQSLAVL